MYSLMQEQPKAVKGLSSMQFIVRRWVELAISEDKDALQKYAESIMTEIDVWKIEKR